MRRAARDVSSPVEKGVPRLMPRAIVGLKGLSPERVCLIKPSSLGDVVHAVPTFLALRELWPSAEFSWVVNRGLRGLLDGLDGLDEVIPYDRAKMRFSASGLRHAGRFLADLRRRRFDLVIDLQGLLRSGIMSLASGAPVRVGFGEAREGATAFYTHVLPRPSATQHAVDRLFRVARELGAKTNHPRFSVALSESDRRWADESLRNVAGPRLVVNVGARWVTKRWLPAHFAEVARLAAASFGAALIAVGAPEDAPLVAEFIEALGPGHACLDLCGKTTLPQLTAVLAASDVVLSNDTGPLHLAAAAGARVVGIYTCTSSEATGPYGTRAVAVSTRIWCAASRKRTCGRLDCMTELTPERVWSVLREQLRAVVAEAPSRRAG